MGKCDNKLRHFRFWCQHVIPLVYDNSLSYYEVLCKVVDMLNHLIDDGKMMADEIEGLKSDLKIVQDWIDNFDTTYAEKIIADHIATMIFVTITQDGHFVYYIPDTWDEITFNTTDYDIVIEGVGANHLVLSY